MSKIHSPTEHITNKKSNRGDSPTLPSKNNILHLSKKLHGIFLGVGEWYNLRNNQSNNYVRK